METDETTATSQPTNALSIYGQADAAMDDFPVLKAFQQYIDAEQSKSRKRMILLCMFFAVLMTILVAVFVLILGQMSRDKQHVNDQLIDFLMKERDRAAQVAAQPAPAPVQQPVANPAQDAAIKAMTDTLSALQKQMVEQKKASDAQIKEAEAKARSAEAQAKAAEAKAATAPSQAEIELQRKAELEAAKIRKAQDELREEKRRIAEEKERLRQAEIERQRRRLYPEYYEKKEKGDPVQSPSTAQTPSPAPVARPKKELSDKDIDDILKEVDALKAADEAKAKDAAKAKAKAKAKKEAKAKADAKAKEEAKTKVKEEGSDEVDDTEKKVDKPIEYFTDTEYALPVKVNGEDAGWSVPLE